MTRERKISPEGKALLEKLAAADTEYRGAVLTLESRIRAEVEEKLHTLRVRRAILAHQTLQAGVPKKRIANVGLHTTATITAYQAIAEGEKYAGGDLADAAPADQRFQLRDNLIAFTPDADEVRAIAEKLELDTNLLPTGAEFTVTDGIITPSTPAITGSGQMHPIVAMVMADGSKHARALVEFAEAAA